MSPFEKLYQLKLDYKILKSFGCSCFPNIRPYNTHKFDFHTIKCVFIGYSPIHKGYKCLSSSGKIYVARDMVFDENTYPFGTLINLNTNEPKLTTNTQLLPCTFKIPIISGDSNDNGSHQFNSQHHQDCSDQDTSNQTSVNIFSNSQNENSSAMQIQIPETSQTQTHTQIINNQTLSTHHMTTRSKSGIFKPKMYQAQVEEAELSDVQTAMTSEKLRQAIKAEYDALINNNTW